MLPADLQRKIILAVNGYIYEKKLVDSPGSDSLSNKVLRFITSPIAANIFLNRMGTDKFLIELTKSTPITNTLVPYTLVENLGYYDLLTGEKVLNPPKLLGGAIVVPGGYMLKVLQSNPLVYWYQYSGNEMGIIKAGDAFKTEREEPKITSPKKTPDETLNIAPVDETDYTQLLLIGIGAYLILK